MKTLSQSQKSSVREIATELGYNTKLENGIRNNFGDPISVNELKLITRREFLACKNLGWISLRQFEEGLSVYYTSENAVTLINKPNMDTVIVEIDTTKMNIESIIWRTQDERIDGGFANRTPVYGDFFGQDNDKEPIIVYKDIICKDYENEVLSTRG